MPLSFPGHPGADLPQQVPQFLGNFRVGVSGQGFAGEFLGEAGLIAVESHPPGAAMQD
jgi:hypothetical protein